jgi:hypothetical protein
VKPLTQVNTTDVGEFGDPEDQFDGQVAGLEDGGYFIVWVDQSGVYSEDGDVLVGQRFDSAGNFVGGEIPFPPTFPGPQRAPGITESPTLGFVETDTTHVLDGDFDRVSVGSDDSDPDPGIGIVLGGVIHDSAVTSFENSSVVVAYSTVENDIAYVFVTPQIFPARNESSSTMSTIRAMWNSLR